MNKKFTVVPFCLFLLPMLFAFASCQCDNVVIHVDDLTQEQTFDVPFKTRGGNVTRSVSIVKNSANDSVWVGYNRIIPPKWTGMLYFNDEYGSEPTTFHYQPYKATKGSIAIKFSVCR